MSQAAELLVHRRGVASVCFLAQLEEYVKPEDIFTEYAYFSSYSDSWLQHAKNYTELMIERFKLGKQHQVFVFRRA